MGPGTESVRLSRRLRCTERQVRPAFQRRKSRLARRLEQQEVQEEMTSRLLREPLALALSLLVPAVALRGRSGNAAD